MAVHIALLRGINVGGNNPLPMTELIKILEKLDCAGIKTYIQSGNAVFDASATDSSSLANRIGKAVLKSHGFEPQVQVVSIKELEKSVRSNPFPEAEEDPKSLHLFFLAEKPKTNYRQRMNELSADAERYSLVANVFYLHAPAGIGGSKLASTAEKVLGVPATARNWRTVTKLLAMAKNC